MFDFLTIEDVLDLHNESLQRYGGATGLRESGLLDSALAAALNTFCIEMVIVLKSLLHTHFTSQSLSASSMETSAVE